jgi:hypothetical protein
MGWLADGRLLVQGPHPTGGSDLFIYGFQDDSVEVEPYLTADWDESTPSISPDSSWVAYTSNESGQWEVYVRALPHPSGRIQISPDGGTEPRWSHDGRTLYYRQGASLVATELGPGPGIEVGATATLFSGENHFLLSRFAQYDVHPDGVHFLVIRTRGASEGTPEEMMVVVNWFQELEEQLSGGR